MSTQHTDVSVLLLGAGSGERMGGVPKAFIECGGTTLLEHAVRTAEKVSNDIRVGLRAADIDKGKRLVGSRAQVLAGGQSRQETIERLAETTQRAFVIVHDIARPFASHAVFQSVLNGARDFSACAAAVEVQVRDSLCRSSNGFAGDMVERAGLMKIQTPQAFDRGLLSELLEKARVNQATSTSLVSTFRHSGYPVKLVAGDPTNIKITYPEDLADVPTAATDESDAASTT